MDVKKAPARPKNPLWDWLKTLALVAVVVFTFRTFVAEAYVIKGQSMLPTFEEADRLLISKLGSADGVEPGDIVVFERDGKRLIKRVIAVGGDFVEIKDGLVFVNDVPLREGYALLDSFTSRRMRVPSGQLFVLGDHRKSSSDSRSWGCVPEEDLLGEAIFRFYPITSWTVY